MSTFVLRRTQDGRFVFLLIASDGSTLSQSQPFATRRSALLTIETIQRIAADSRVVDLSRPNS